MSLELKSLGRHIQIEYYGCDEEIIRDNELIEKLMNEAAILSNATIVDSVFHHFNPHGVSGAVIIEESHLTIHTWPEYRYASVDVYTCGSTVDPWVAFDFLEKSFKSTRSESFEVPRGMADKIRKFVNIDIDKVQVKGGKNE